MVFRTTIFASMLFITHSSYSMKIVKKNIHKKEKKQKNYRYPIITDFLIIQKLTKESFDQLRTSGGREKIPQDIATQIQHYCMQLRDKDFKNNFFYLDLWNDFQIPLHCHYHLTPKHIHSLNEYFKYEPSSIPYPHEKRLAMHYQFDYKEDYEEFITIPIEIRQYLTKLPQSAYKKNKFDFTNTDINEHKIVQMLTLSNDLKGKYILPEEVTKKIKLDVNR